MNQKPSDEQTDAAVVGLIAWLRRRALAMGLTGVILVAVVSSIVTVLATNIAAPAAGVDTQPLTNTAPQVVLPAAPVVGDPVAIAENIACHGDKIEKARYGSMASEAFTYTAQQLDAKTGATAFVRWTDVAGLRDVVVVEINDQKARPKPNAATTACLKNRAKAVGGPIQ